MQFFRPTYHKCICTALYKEGEEGEVKPKPKSNRSNRNRNRKPNDQTQVSETSGAHVQKNSAQVSKTERTFSKVAMEQKTTKVSESTSSTTTTTSTTNQTAQNLAQSVQKLDIKDGVIVFLINFSFNFDILYPLGSFFYRCDRFDFLPLFQYENLIFGILFFSH